MTVPAAIRRRRQGALRRTSPAGQNPPRASVAVPQLILTVEFSSADGRTWQAIGGGDTLADAIGFAQDSCPDGTWEPIRWNDLQGD